VSIWILILNLVYAALGVVLMYFSFRVIDRLLHEFSIPTELQRGNVAAAIFIGSLFVSIALIIGRAIS
jgi:uncharacterized membrane protein YjfL (UPF0719 family)